MAIFNAVVEVVVSTNGQGEFDAPDDITTPSISAIVFEGLFHPHGVSFEISGETLTWDGPTLAEDDVLYLLYCNESGDPLFNKQQTLYASEQGQTVFRLDEAPTGTVLFIVGNTVHIEDTVISVDGSELTWSGPEIDKGSFITVLYGV